jgi:GT2 family glycosyltransferase
LTSQAVLQKVGLLDESYDFYLTEDEWCHRVQKYGYEVAYIAEAQITHLGDQSISRVREWARKSEYQSALDYFGRYYDLNEAGVWTLWLSTLLSFLFRASYFTVVKIFFKNETGAETYRNLLSWILRQHPRKIDPSAT